MTVGAVLVIILVLLLLAVVARYVGIDPVVVLVVGALLIVALVFLNHARLR